MAVFSELLTDQEITLLWFSSPGKGKPLQRKVKPPKKQEEKEKKGKGKPQEDDLKDSLADDDSSSTTTETSNPDTEPLLKEVWRAPINKRGKKVSPAARKTPSPRWGFDLYRKHTLWGFLLRVHRCAKRSLSCRKQSQPPPWRSSFPPGKNTGKHVDKLK